MSRWMTVFAIIVICLALFVVVVAVRSEPVDITFEWDSYTGIGLAGYNLYQSQVESTYAFGPGCEIAKIHADSTGYVLPGVESDSTYYWVLTAYDKWGNESGPSNECSNDKTAPAVPSGFSCR